MQKALVVILACLLVRSEYVEAQHHPPDHHGPHDAPCLNDHECHCEPPNPDTTPVCVDGHCQCLHAVTHCIHNAECHCEPHGPDNTPVCIDGQCSCHHPVAHCTHNAECHCDPHGPDNTPFCIDGQCSCHHAVAHCTHNAECHCEPHGPDNTPLCIDGQCSCHHADPVAMCTHNAECHCEPHGPDDTPFCVNGHCSCHHKDFCAHDADCHCEHHGPDTKALCMDARCSCHHVDFCVEDYHCQCDASSIPTCNHGHCKCSAQPSCMVDSDCAASHCTYLGLYPFCRTSLANGQSYCDCADCTDDRHCSSQCGNGAIPKCTATSVQDFSCHCESPSTTKSTSNSTLMFITLLQNSTSVSSPPKTTHTTTVVPTTKHATVSHPWATIGTLSTPKTTTSSTTTTTAAMTTTASTTSKTTASVPTSSKKCHVCGNIAASISCDTRSIYLGNLQTCPGGSDYCMTDIVHDGGISPQIYKRCVTKAECIDKWLHQTSDLDSCLKYGNVLTQGSYSCHFCCVSDGCNSAEVPDKSTWYSIS
uniref:Tenascin-like isoform X2 n=1 Tax=Crassostrea virginica TaxID=6565 RepID=A0A8B8EU11_CRAVI|nr:tenascin-like isoform X2 [Crassostrea virginica]